MYRIWSLHSGKVSFEFCPELYVIYLIASKEPLCIEGREVNGRYISEQSVVVMGTSFELLRIDICFRRISIKSSYYYRMEFFVGK
jgi:hypothetical protein